MYRRRRIHVLRIHGFQRERERERERYIYISLCVCACRYRVDELDRATSRSTEVLATKILKLASPKTNPFRKPLYKA